MKTARDTGMATSKLVREIADLLALGYLRYRQRAAGEAARMVRERSARNPLNDLAYVAPRARNGTGDTTTPET